MLYYAFVRSLAKSSFLFFGQLPILLIGNVGLHLSRKTIDWPESSHEAQCRGQSQRFDFNEDTSSNFGQAYKAIFMREGMEFFENLTLQPSVGQTNGALLRKCWPLTSGCGKSILHLLHSSVAQSELVTFC